MPQLMLEHGVDDYYAKFWSYWIQALRKTQPELLAYLIYMVRRLLEMKSILKPTGSIYLHCDPTASHYVKVMMDGIFGHNNFRSEIIWKRTSSHNSARRWGPVHDVVLFYSKSEAYTWNRVSQPYDDAYIDAFYRHRDENGRYQLDNLTGAGVRSGDSGKPWRDVNPTDTGRHWAVPPVPGVGEKALKTMSVQERLDLLNEKGLVYWPKKGAIPRFKRYLNRDLGVAAQDVISDIDPISTHAKERLGYPTQKPTALLERIIKASSNPGDVVFDPFCGCGTTIYAAESTGRQWIGCDIAILSIRLVTQVLESKYRLTKGTDFEVDGVPVSVEQAEELFKRDPFQFQHWIVEKVGGFPTRKLVGDLGVDGRVYFETKDGLRDMVLSVKGGGIKPSDIRDLRGVLERETDTVIAGLLSLHEATKTMREEAAKAGTYSYSGVSYDRIQLLTVKQILEDKRSFHTPSVVGSRASTGQQPLPFSSRA